MLGVITSAALVFPFVERARGTWDSSPYRTRKFLGLPLMSWRASVSLVYLGILFGLLIFTEEMRDSNFDPWILYAIVWIPGIVRHFIWRQRTMSGGRAATREAPPPGPSFGSGSLTALPNQPSAAGILTVFDTMGSTTVI